jgi:23S rRNA (adenine2503-C2)-methyltransferase
MPSGCLLDLTFEELAARLEDIGIQPYRAGQIWRAVFADLATAYDQITTLPKSLRAQLDEAIPWPEAATARMLLSKDSRTAKVLHRLDDGETIESVLMRYARRKTACISTQVGCAMGCRFCATGQSGFRRNLSAGEIVGQVLALARLLPPAERISHVVFMGMGEPLANYEATLQSAHILNDPRGFSLGARSFTISTVGIVPGIERLAREDLQVNLAVSLHAADDALRSLLVPANQRYPVTDVVRACREYVSRTHRRVTFEIALISGINDADVHARQLLSVLRGVLCHVNLIAFNPIPGTPWRPSNNDRVQAFLHIVEEAGIPATVRVSRGADIQAACGQLRAEEPS